MRTAAGQRQSFEQPLSHAVACCDKPRGSDRVRSMGQKKVRARKRGRAKTQTIGTFSPGLYILYFLKLPAPPRADLSGIVYIYIYSKVPRKYGVEDKPPWGPETNLNVSQQAPLREGSWLHTSRWGMEAIYCGPGYRGEPGQV